MNDDSTNDQQRVKEDEETCYRMTYIDLQRVLHIMENESQFTTRAPSSWYQARLEHARKLWLELFEQHQRQSQRQQRSSFSGGCGSTTLLVPEGEMHELQSRVQQACEKSNKIICGLEVSNFSSRGTTKPRSIRQLLKNKRNEGAAKKAGSKEGDDATVDREPFILNDECDAALEEMGDVELKKDRENSVLPATSNQNVSNKTYNADVLSPQELQEQQREQMEEAIRQMASQMKAQTESIHQTLQNQARDLDDLEKETSEKVDQVKNITEKVEDHVKKSWTQSIGTWTLLFTIVGIFAFTLVTIVMAPKRKNVPCLFFCGDVPRYPYEQHHSIDPYSQLENRSYKRYQIGHHGEDDNETQCRDFRDGTRSCTTKEERQQLEGTSRRSSRDETDETQSTMTRRQGTHFVEDECDVSMSGECIETRPGGKADNKKYSEDGVDEMLNLQINDIHEDLDQGDDDPAFHDDGDVAEEEEENEYMLAVTGALPEQNRDLSMEADAKDSSYDGKMVVGNIHDRGDLYNEEKELSAGIDGEDTKAQESQHDVGSDEALDYQQSFDDCPHPGTEEDATEAHISHSSVSEHEGDVNLDEHQAQESQQAVSYTSVSELEGKLGDEHRVQASLEETEPGGHVGQPAHDAVESLDQQSFHDHAHRGTKEDSRETKISHTSVSELESNFSHEKHRAPESEEAVVSFTSISELEGKVSDDEHDEHGTDEHGAQESLAEVESGVSVGQPVHGAVESRDQQSFDDYAHPGTVEDETKAQISDRSKSELEGDVNLDEHQAQQTQGASVSYTSVSELAEMLGDDELLDEHIAQEPLEEVEAGVDVSQPMPDVVELHNQQAFDDYPPGTEEEETEALIFESQEASDSFRSVSELDVNVSNGIEHRVQESQEEVEFVVQLDQHEQQSFDDHPHPGTEKDATEARIYFISVSELESDLSVDEHQEQESQEASVPYTSLSDLEGKISDDESGNGESLEDVEFGGQVGQREEHSFDDHAHLGTEDDATEAPISYMSASELGSNLSLDERHVHESQEAPLSYTSVSELERKVGDDDEHGGHVAQESLEEVESGVHVAHQGAVQSLDQQSFDDYPYPGTVEDETKAHISDRSSSELESDVSLNEHQTQEPQESSVSYTTLSELEAKVGDDDLGTQESLAEFKSGVHVGQHDAVELHNQRSFDDYSNSGTVEDVTEASLSQTSLSEFESDLSLDERHVQVLEEASVSYTSVSEFDGMVGADEHRAQESLEESETGGHVGAPAHGPARWHDQISFDNYSHRGTEEDARETSISHTSVSELEGDLTLGEHVSEFDRKVEDDEHGSQESLEEVESGVYVDQPVRDALESHHEHSFDEHPHRGTEEDATKARMSYTSISELEGEVSLDEHRAQESQEASVSTHPLPRSNAYP